MERKATPSTMEVIRSLAGVSAGRDAASAVESAPSTPPRSATFFQDLGTAALSTFDVPRRGYTVATRATITAEKVIAIGRRPATILERSVQRPKSRKAR